MDVAGSKRPERLVLSDASPLIALAKVGGLPWLERLLGKVCLTSVVHGEVVTGHSQPGKAEIEAAIKRGALEVIEDEWSEPQFPELDEGEASTLRAAKNIRRPILILMDERLGRAVARELGFPVTGTAGVIFAAKQRKLISAVRPVLEMLLKKDFRMAPELIEAVLKEAREPSMAGRIPADRLLDLCPILKVAPYARDGCEHRVRKGAPNPVSNSALDDGSSPGEMFAELLSATLG